eukprot:TRINITY_DN10038_c0_g1_i2.p1 TRINITY_DN10038_c0_g1~~TRINITY_DN10038_c0_g1_i2.p1  ORF type:complete len:657 (-),score=146.61 TRINITY_DN10038_c0_g1_i2:92-2062(-)
MNILATEYVNNYTISMVTTINGGGGWYEIVPLTFIGCELQKVRIRVEEPVISHLAYTTLISGSLFLIALVIHCIPALRTEQPDSQKPLLTIQATAHQAHIQADDALPWTRKLRLTFSFDTTPFFERNNPAGAHYVSMTRILLVVSFIYSVCSLPLSIVNYFNTAGIGVTGVERFMSIAVGISGPVGLANNVWVSASYVFLFLASLAMFRFARELEARILTGGGVIAVHLQSLPKDTDLTQLPNVISQAASGASVVSFEPVLHPDTNEFVGDVFVTLERKVTTKQLRTVLQQRLQLSTMSCSTASSPDQILWKNMFITPRPRYYLLFHILFIIAAHVIGTAVSYAALLAQSLLRAPAAIYYLQDNLGFMTAVLGFFPPVFVTIAQMALVALAGRVVAYGRFTERWMELRRDMSLKRAVSSAVYLTGPILLLALAPGTMSFVFQSESVAIAFVNDFFLAVMIQSVLFEPAMRLLNVRQHVSKFLSFCCGRRFMPVTAAQREFPIAARFAIYINLWAIAQTGAPILPVFLFPCTLGMYLFDRYWFLFHARKPISERVSLRMAQYSGFYFIAVVFLQSFVTTTTQAILFPKVFHATVNETLSRVLPAALLLPISAFMYVAAVRRTRRRRQEAITNAKARLDEVMPSYKQPLSFIDDNESY